MSTMARGRQSTQGRMSTQQPTQATQGRNTEAPEYQPPTFPLNPAAQRALAQLARSSNLLKLNKSISEAQTQLTDSAVQMNDRVTAATKSQKRTREKRQREQEGEDEEQTALEQELAQFQSKVDGMTQRMEESMRKLVDHQHSVEAIKQSLAKTEQHARNTASTQASTQNARTQRRTRRTTNEDGEEEEEEDAGDEEYPEFTPTDPAGGTPGQVAPVDVFRSNVEDAKLRYQSLGQAERYTDDTAYVNFRETVHDAVHSDKPEMPPLDKNKWFSEGGAAAPGITNRNVDAENEDEDDDLAISKATISTKCLLTLREFVEPYTSKKCPHSFEKEAILGLIAGSERRTAPAPGQRAGEKCVICPVGGCQEQLTRGDLGVDKVIVRKIQRLQRSKQLQQEADDNDSDAGNGDTQNRAFSIDDDAEDDAEEETAVKPKNEPRATGASSRAPPASSGRPSTQVIVMSDSEEEEDDVDEDSMVE